MSLRLRAAQNYDVAKSLSRINVSLTIKPWTTKTVPTSLSNWATEMPCDNYINSGRIVVSETWERVTKGAIWTSF